MLLVASLNFWACVVSKDVPGQLQHVEVVDVHAQPGKIAAVQRATIVADQGAVIQALNAEVAQLKNGTHDTAMIQELRAKLEAQQREATRAKIQALEAELESQKKLAIMTEALEAKQREHEAVEWEFRAKVTEDMAQQIAAVEKLQQKLAGSEEILATSYSHRLLQVTTEGRTVTESSAGPPASCAPNAGATGLGGAMYFNTDTAEFLGCNGAAWEGLGGSNGNFLCQDGWGGGSCDEDFRAPTIACEEGTVSIQQERNVFPHTLTSADVPRPMIRDTGPGNPGSIRIELSVVDSELAGDADPSDTKMVVSSATPYSGLLDWSTTNTESDSLSIVVDIGTVTTFEYRAYDTAGNMASCTVDVTVADIDECDDGSHSCVANAVCENLANSRGEQATGTYECLCLQGTTANPDGYTECLKEPWEDTGDSFDGMTKYTDAGVDDTSFGSGGNSGAVTCCYGGGRCPVMKGRTYSPWIVNSDGTPFEGIQADGTCPSGVNKDTLVDTCKAHAELLGAAAFGTWIENDGVDGYCTAFSTACKTSRGTLWTMQAFGSNFAVRQKAFNYGKYTDNANTGCEWIGPVAADGTEYRSDVIRIPYTDPSGNRVSGSSKQFTRYFALYMSTDQTYGDCPAGYDAATTTWTRTGQLWLNSL